MSNKTPNESIAGIAAARGLAAGPVFFYNGDGERSIPEYRIRPDQIDSELVRLRRARQSAQRDIENLIAVLRERTRENETAVFEGHLMILEDPLLRERTEEIVRTELLNVEAALRKTILEFREKFDRMNDAYFRERVQDLNDVERRLQAALAGFADLPSVLPEKPVVIAAGELTSSDVVRLPRELVLALVTGVGSATSHVALLARSLGIPAVAGVRLAGRVEPGALVLVDGTHGTVTLDPDPATVRKFESRLHEERRLSDEIVAGAATGVLKDGESVALLANVQPGLTVSELKSGGARGVGLYRSEYLWLGKSREPTESEQFAAYREVAETAARLGAGASATIRVLDIGGDKLLRGVSAAEANPFLGNRSLRYLLSHPEIFRTQLWAILKASAFGPVKLLYPMVAVIEELDAANRLLDEVRAELDAAGIDYDRRLEVGIMIEVPAAAINAAAFAGKVDFFSIGTNDLIQYSLAADRGNEAVAYLYQPLNPAVIRLMKLTFEAAAARGIPVSVCGASAGDPIVGALWVGMGAKALSMSPPYIPAVSRLLSQLTRRDLDEYARFVMTLDPAKTGSDAYAAAREWLKARSICID